MQAELDKVVSAISEFYARETFLLDVQETAVKIAAAVTASRPMPPEAFGASKYRMRKPRIP